jgi:hypothetical protein
MPTIAPEDDECPGNWRGWEVDGPELRDADPPPRRDEAAIERVAGSWRTDGDERRERAVESWWEWSVWSCGWAINRLTVVERGSE